MTGAGIGIMVGTVIGWFVPPVGPVPMTPVLLGIAAVLILGGAVQGSRR